MKRHKLDAVREQIRDRMQAGELMDWHAIWRATDDGSRAWAHDTLRHWHKAGHIHVAQWIRGESGPAKPLYRWGSGKDATRPARLSHSQRCATWRKTHPEKVAVARKRASFSARKGPMLDPIVSALLGYRRHGAGWVRRENAAVSGRGAATPEAKDDGCNASA